MKLLIGVNNTAKYLNCGTRTIQRLVERASKSTEWDDTFFPKPFQEQPQKNGVLRVWRTEDLKNFKPRKRGERITK